ncbi:MAG: hypothetical protein QOH03_3541, partial [Kribbellaceae bacterium]|nr:hypothetical protein [Kribbellaceae bacterium]
MVRAADESYLDGDRAVDGDLGARAGRCRCARRYAGPSNRLKHVAHLAVRTRDFAYLLHGRTAPDTEIRVELTGPDGDVWSWGPEDAEQRVTGPALDFCLLATQRRHRDDLAVVAEGADADEWLGIAQAFAGSPGKGRKPGQFVGTPADGRGSRQSVGTPAG